MALAASVAAAHAQQPSANPQYNWSGFYIGAHLGGALELTDVADPFGPSIYGATVRSPGPIAGAQAGYNWQFGQALVGLEADASWADLYGTETCFAYSGFYVSANCLSDASALGTLAARFGWLVADAGTLLYGKAGAAWRHGDVDATTNGDPGFPTTRASGTSWGWMLGAGVERALSHRWSVSTEYDFLSFGDRGIATPTGSLQGVPSPSPNDLLTIPPTATASRRTFTSSRSGSTIGSPTHQSRRRSGARASCPSRSPEPRSRSARATFTAGAASRKTSASRAKA